MYAFVTLQEASDHLRRDTTDDDDDLQAKIYGCSAAVKGYLKTGSPFLPELDSNLDPVYDSEGNVVYERDSNGDKIVHPLVEQATLILLSEVYDKTRTANMEDWQQGYLPMAVQNLLYTLRTPAMA